MKKNDLIIFTGTSGVGKTYGISILKNYLQEQNIPFNKTTLSTGNYIVDLIKQDDKKGGYHHIHPWNKTSQLGHSHATNEPVLPFTTVDDVLNYEAYSMFFANLSTLPANNKIYIADWTAGVNRNTREPFSHVDRSYRKMRSMFEKGVWQTNWMQRVIAVVHVTASYAIRKERNEQKKQHMNPEIWKLSDMSFNYYADDDFAEIEDYFSMRKVKVTTIKNEDSDFKRKLIEVIGNEVVSPIKSS